jgi:hypothetical protein
MDDDRRSNVAGAEGGVEASPAPEGREMTGREAELAARTMADREVHEDSVEAVGEGGEGDDVDGRP